MSAFLDSQAEDLTGLFEPCARASAVRSPIAAYSALRLAFDGKDLRVTGSDSNTWVSRVAPSMGGDEFDTCVDASRLLSTVKALSGAVRLEVEANQVRVVAGLDVYKLPSLDARDFPQPKREETACTMVSAGELKRLTGAVKAFTVDGQTDFRCGVELIAEGGKLMARACTHHTASKAFIPYDGETFGAILFPSDLAAMLALAGSSAEEIRIEVGNAMVRASASAGQVVARRVQGAFPANYDKVFPSATVGHWVVDVTAFRDALNRALMFADQGAKGLRRALIECDGDRLRISSKDPARGEGHAHVDCVADEKGRSFRFAVSGDYVLDACQSCPDKGMRIGFNEHNWPVGFSGTDSDWWAASILPMHLGGA